MRHNDVRSLWVVCAVCDHEAVLNVDAYAARSLPLAHALSAARAAASSAPTCGPIGASDHRVRV